MLPYLTIIFPFLLEPVFRFKFADAGNMAPPLISFSEVAFSYSGKKKDYLFKDVSFGIHPSSRIVLVGPNGAGDYADDNFYGFHILYSDIMYFLPFIYFRNVNSLEVDLRRECTHGR